MSYYRLRTPVERNIHLRTFDSNREREPEIYSTPPSPIQRVAEIAILVMTTLGIVYGSAYVYGARQEYRSYHAPIQQGEFDPNRFKKDSHTFEQDVLMYILTGNQPK